MSFKDLRRGTASFIWRKAILSIVTGIYQTLVFLTLTAFGESLGVPYLVVGIVLSYVNIITSSILMQRFFGAKLNLAHATVLAKSAGDGVLTLNPVSYGNSLVEQSKILPVMQLLKSTIKDIQKRYQGSVAGCAADCCAGWAISQGDKTVLDAVEVYYRNHSAYAEATKGKGANTFVVMALSFVVTILSVGFLCITMHWNVFIALGAAFTVATTLKSAVLDVNTTVRLTRVLATLVPITETNGHTYAAVSEISPAFCQLMQTGSHMETPDHSTVRSQE